MQQRKLSFSHRCKTCHDLFHLTKFLQFFLFFARDFDKQLCLWLVGLSFLTLLFYAAAKSVTTSLLRSRLILQGASPHLYTFQRFVDTDSPNHVYCKLPIRAMSLRGHLRIDAQMMYIGSTSLGVTKREQNRCSKVRQVHRGRLPKAELAVQYWSDSGTYFHYCTLLLQRYPDYRTAWAAEQSLIQTWQPSLNYPFICRSFLKKATGLVPANKRPHLTVGSDKLGRRLYKKLRRHLPGRHPHII